MRHPSPLVRLELETTARDTGTSDQNGHRPYHPQPHVAASMAADLLGVLVLAHTEYDASTVDSFRVTHC